MQATVSPEQRRAAKREIVRQIEQGASAKVARLHSAVPMHRATVYRLLKRVQSEGEKAFVDGRHGHPVKLRGEVLAFLSEHCQANPYVSSPAVQRAIEERFGCVPSVSQLNRVRASLGLSRRPVQLRKKSLKPSSRLSPDTTSMQVACSCWRPRTRPRCSLISLSRSQQKWPRLVPH